MIALGQKYYVSGYQTVPAKKYWRYTFFHKDVQKNVKDLQFAYSELRNLLLLCHLMWAGYFNFLVSDLSVLKFD